jgi:hypothetical protein
MSIPSDALENSYGNLPGKAIEAEHEIAIPRQLIIIDGDRIDNLVYASPTFLAMDEKGELYAVFRSNVEGVWHVNNRFMDGRE